MPDKPSAIVEATISVSGGIAQTDALWDLLIQNKWFQQVVGGGYAIDDATLAAARLITSRMKESIKSVEAGLNSLESGLSGAAAVPRTESRV